MAQSFESFNPNVVRKETVKKNELPRKSSEIQSHLALKERKRFTEMTPNTEMTPKNFTVWIIQTHWSRGYQLDVPDGFAIQEKINPEMNEDEYENSDTRFVDVKSIRQGDLQYELSTVFQDLGKINTNLTPDLVILYGGEGYSDNQPDGDISLSARTSEVKSILDIRKAADSVLYTFFSSGEKITGDWEQEFLHSHILGDAYATTTLEKHTVTEDLAANLIASSLFGMNNHEWSLSGKAFDEYVRTGEESPLRRIVTDGRIRTTLRQEEKLSRTRILENYRTRTKYKQKDAGFLSEEEYFSYRSTLTQKARDLASEMTADQIRETVYASLKKIIDERKDEYLSDVEQDAAEQRLIQPFIVSVGKSFKYRNASLSAGADATLPTLSSHEIEKLISFVNRVRTSQASITRERMRRNKNDFYSTVVDQIDERSEQTADTEKELLLLNSLFERVGAKKILDVGSGFGRLSLPLAQKGYSVTGIDANPKLLNRAKESAGKKKNLHYKKGDIIEYKNTIEHGSYDAVYYGWHSFLEAYGLGNALSSLRSAYETLRPGGVVTFDQPSRENLGFQDGWYGDDAHGYIAYLMDDEELQLLLRLAGFENTKILHWTTKPSELYPNGMKKISVVAQKPTLTETTDK